MLLVSKRCMTSGLSGIGNFTSGWPVHSVGTRINFLKATFVTDLIFYECLGDYELTDNGLCEIGDDYASYLGS